MAVGCFSTTSGAFNLLVVAFAELSIYQYTSHGFALCIRLTYLHTSTELYTFAATPFSINEHGKSHKSVNGQLFAQLIGFDMFEMSCLQHSVKFSYVRFVALPKYIYLFCIYILLCAFVCNTFRKCRTYCLHQATISLTTIATRVSALN